MLQIERSCYPPKYQEIRRVLPSEIDTSPIVFTASATVTQNQVTSTSSNLQAGSSMSNTDSTSEQETSSVEDYLNKCGYSFSYRSTPYEKDFLNKKFPSKMESKHIQEELSSSIQNQAQMEPKAPLSVTFQDASANNDGDFMNKIREVLEHRIKVLNLSVGDTCAITGIIFLLVILHNYPIMTGAIAIVTWIAYRQGMS